MPAMSAVFASTQLWPIACAGSLPAWCSVTSTSVQSAAMEISFLSNCIASVPEISTLQVLAANALADAASSVANARVRMSFMDGSCELMRYAETLLHHGTRGRVLQELFLGGIEMMLDREGGQSRLVEPGQDQFLLTRVGIDVSHGEDAGNAGLELLGVDLERLLLELHAPLGDRAELRMQAEE